MSVDTDFLRDADMRTLSARTAVVMELRLKQGAELLSSQMVVDQKYNWYYAILFWRIQ